jgi:hypothetical protein
MFILLVRVKAQLSMETARFGSVQNISVRKKYTRRYDSTHISGTKQYSWSTVSVTGTNSDWCYSLGPAHSISCVFESHNASTTIILFTWHLDYKYDWQSFTLTCSFSVGLRNPGFLFRPAPYSLARPVWLYLKCTAVPSCSCNSFYIATEEYQAMTTFRKRSINECLIRFL